MLAYKSLLCLFLVYATVSARRGGNRPNGGSNGGSDSTTATTTTTEATTVSIFGAKASKYFSICAFRTDQMDQTDMDQALQP